MDSCAYAQKMLHAWRQGDANMRSVWLCSRNDVIGNLVVKPHNVPVFCAPPKTL